MYVNASSSCETPSESSSNRTGEPVLRRNGPTRNRSTTSPVTKPAATASTKASHQFQCQSITHFARRSADSVPSWAWARFRNRLDL